MHICTIVARNYVAFARVLATSFREHHPAGRCTVLLVDAEAGSTLGPDEPFDVVTPQEAGIPEFHRMAASYDVLELSTAVKPFFLTYLLRANPGEAVTYLDPDIQIFAPLDDIDALACEHGLVLTPHTTEPIPDDGEKPTDVDILTSGIFNLGFAAVGPRHADGELLSWWGERLRHHCIVDHCRGYFVDQRWMDFVPAFTDDLHVLRDPGCNVAYWNLATRRLEERPDGGVAVNGEPLRFYHFSGFDPNKPHLLSKHQTRTRLSENRVLARLCADYAEAIAAQGHAEARTVPYAFDTLPDGTRIHPQLRRLHLGADRDGHVAAPIFTPEGLHEFQAWLAEPAPHGAAAGINRFLYWHWESRGDLKAAYPDLDGDDGEGFAGWVYVYGHQLGGLTPELMPPRPDWLAEDEGERRGGDGDGGAGTGNGDGASRSPAAARAAAPREGTAARPAAETPIPGEPWGVNVAGFLRSELGVGEAARLAVAALDQRGVPALPVHGEWVPSSRQGHRFVTVGTDDAVFPVNLICVNGDLMEQFAEDAGERFFANRHNVGFWWWEVDALPESWMPGFERLDEVWVGSDHIADALQLHAPVPVIKVTLPVSVPRVIPHTRDELGLPGGFLFLFMFDYHSVFERKNPLAVVEAFEQAFPPGAGASLVIKSINGDSDPDNAERLALAAAGHPDVHLVDQYVTAAEKTAMMAAADCYVSLHRAEGFGLTPAESMALGKPVIATRYSGNLDFMTPRNSYLVDYRETAIGPEAWPYPEGGTWAEPDVEHAARLMREVFDDQEAARRRGARAAREIAETHSLEAAGRSMEQRLDAIRERRASPGRLATPPAAAEVYEVVASGPPRGGRRGPAAFVRRAALRAMRPWTHHQQRVDHTIAEVTANLEREAVGTARSVAAASAVQLAEMRRQATRLDRAEHVLRELRGADGDSDGGDDAPPRAKSDA